MSERRKTRDTTAGPPMSSLEGAWATVGVRATISASGTEPLSHSRCSPVRAYCRGSHLSAFLSCSRHLVVLGSIWLMPTWKSEI